jgi:hypothetical protein
MAAPLPRLTLELSPHAGPSPSNPKVLADMLRGSSPNGPADALPGQRSAESAAAAARPSSAQRERRLRQRSRSGVDIGDIGSNRAHRAGSPRSLGARSASTRTLSATGRVPSADSGAGGSEPSDPSPGSVRGRLNRRRSRRRASSEAGDSRAARIVTLWRSERVIQTFCCGAPGLMIHPHTPFCQVKDVFFMILVLYSSSWEPFVAAFEEGDEFGSGFGLFVDTLFWVDIAFNFFTGYEKTSGVELEPKAVALNYFTGWFGIDFVATFPWEIVLEIGMTEDDEIVSRPMQYAALMRLLRLIRILRILRLGRIIERLSTFFRMRSAFIKIVKLIFQLLLVVHLLACFFYLMSFLFPADPIIGANTVF